MSRHSPSINLELDDGRKVKIGHQEVIMTCQGTGCPNSDPDKMPIKEMYVSRETGKCVIIYEDEVV